MSLFSWRQLQLFPSPSTLWFRSFSTPSLSISSLSLFRVTPSLSPKSRRPKSSCLERVSLSFSLDAPILIFFVLSVCSICPLVSFCIYVMTSCSVHFFFSIVVLYIRLPCLLIKRVAHVTSLSQNESSITTALYLPPFRAISTRDTILISVSSILSKKYFSSITPISTFFSNFLSVTFHFLDLRLFTRVS